MLPYIGWLHKNNIRAKIIGRKLLELDYDMVVFQEAFTSKCRNVIGEILSEKYPYQYGPFNYSSWSWKTNSGLWVVSRFPLEELKVIEFDESAGFDKVARKGAVLFKGNIHDTKFQLMATHLQSSDYQNIRERQYKEITSLLDEFYSPSMAQILCGDFNTERRKNECYQSMLHSFDAVDGKISGELQTTYDEEKNTLAVRKNGVGEVLDYILIRNAGCVQSVEREIVDFYNSNENYKGNLSDHYALEAQINFIKK